MIYLPEFKYYKDAIVAFFEKLKQEDRTVWNGRITRAYIKKRYLQGIQSGMTGSDKTIVRKWLESAVSDDELYSVLKKKTADDFKAFEVFFGDPGMNPMENNVEMIAVLIGFPHRPFDPAKLDIYRSFSTVDAIPAKIRENSTVQSGETPDKEKKEGDDEGGYTEGETRKKAEFRWSYFLVGATVLGLLSVLFLSQRPCMSWAGISYQAEPCGLPFLKSSAIPLDKEKLKGFRKVLRTDTMSGYAREHFWYTRVGNHYEVFTGPGVHPLYPNLALRPVTDFIINYCHNHPDER